MAEKIDEAVAHIAHQSAHPEHIKANQKSWLELVDQCSQNLRCLNEMLERRVERLEKIEKVLAQAPAKTTEPVAEPEGHAEAHSAEPEEATPPAEKDHEHEDEAAPAAPPASAAPASDPVGVGARVASWVSAHPLWIAALLVGSWVLLGVLFAVQKMGGWSKLIGRAPKAPVRSAPAAVPGKPPRVSGKVAKPAPAVAAKPQKSKMGHGLDRALERVSWWRFFVKHQFRNHPLRAYAVLVLIVLSALAIAYGCVQGWPQPSHGQAQIQASPQASDKDDEDDEKPKPSAAEGHEGHQEESTH
jgi:hypothetical protein